MQCNSNNFKEIQADGGSIWKVKMGLPSDFTQIKQPTTRLMNFRALKINYYRKQIKSSYKIIIWGPGYNFQPWPPPLLVCASFSLLTCVSLPLLTCTSHTPCICGFSPSMCKSLMDRTPLSWDSKNGKRKRSKNWIEIAWGLAFLVVLDLIRTLNITSIV